MHLVPFATLAHFSRKMRRSRCRRYGGVESLSVKAGVAERVNVKWDGGVLSVWQFLFLRVCPGDV